MIILNRIIPFGSYKAINLCGLIFSKKNLTVREMNHERIHTRQCIELLFVGFYLWYILEWLIRFFICRNNRKAYYDICFEREAYTHESNIDYLKSRPLFSSFKYLKKQQTRL